MHRKLALPVACIASQGLAEHYLTSSPPTPVGEPKQKPGVASGPVSHDGAPWQDSQQPTRGPGAKHPIFSRSLPARGVVCVPVCVPPPPKVTTQGAQGTPPSTPYFSHCHRLVWLLAEEERANPGFPMRHSADPPTWPCSADQSENCNKKATTVKK